MKSIAIESFFQKKIFEPSKTGKGWDASKNKKTAERLFNEECAMLFLEKIPSWYQ